MKNFNAKQASDIVNSRCKNELNDILTAIKNEAEKGNTVLLLYNSIDIETKRSLIEKGFKIEPQSSISIQKEGLYYSIRWIW